jgi:hypothetical protein
MSYKTLFDYYLSQELFPTHGGFGDEAALARHEEHRRALFMEKLRLPPRLFKTASLLEFGPDTGENSLIFARWGAQCSLCEPNTKAHPIIRDYFKRFDLQEKLEVLSGDDISAWVNRPDEHRVFDFVDAEGFIYTIKPDRVWIDLLARIVKPDGMAILFFVERFGSFFELLLKVVYSRYKQLTVTASWEASRMLFQTKWDTIPHRRTIDSFAMDVLENPFMRLSYFLEPQDLCRQMAEAGFTIYSSWPVYQDALAMRWFKSNPSPSERLAETMAFIGQSRLSHVFGCRLFLREPRPDLEAETMRLLELTDGLIDGFPEENIAQVKRILSHMDEVIASPEVVASAEHRQRTGDTITMVCALFDLLQGGNAAAIADHCNHNPSFIKQWGMPSHFAVFRRET